MSAKSFGRRTARVLLYILATSYLALIGLALYSDHLIFYPPRPSSYAPGPDLLQLRLRDGTPIAATYLRNDAAMFTLLYSHGNAEDLGTTRDALRYLEESGFSVFAYDYPGYGLSGGTANERGIYDAEDAAYDYLTEQLHVPPERIILYGRSLGAAPAIDLASKRRVAGLISDSAFTSAFRVLTRVRLLPWDKFDNLGRIGDVRCPVLFIQGASDTVVPPSHGHALFARANPPKYSYWIAGVDHNEVILAEHYLDTIQAFASTLPVRQTSAVTGR